MTSSSTSPTPSRSLPPALFESKLSEQLSRRREQSGSSFESCSSADKKGKQLGPPLRYSPKSRSLSDAAKPASSTPPLSEDERPASKDDSSLSSLPATPQRPSGLQRGLSLNLPPKLSSPASTPNRTPLSPKLDSSNTYGSPGSVLPRRSRGLDFSRACTNLHHSIIAESSPDSSPTIGGRGVTIPQRRSSPGSTSNPPFSTSGPADRATVSSSVSSVNMMESDTSSSEEDDEAMIGDRDDMMITNTPQATRMGGGMNPFAVGNVSSPGNDWMGGYSQAAASLMSFQRARFRNKGRSRHSSSSASGNSSKPSPGPLSPPVMKSIENPNAGYFAPKNGLQSRRESLSLGTHDLRLSDLSDDGESRGTRGHSPGGPNPEGGPLGVIRRAVTRRGSLLPKTKTFARIRAALVEESSPINSEAKREAEVIRQVRESDPSPQQSPPSGAASFHPSEPTGIEPDVDNLSKPEPAMSAESSFSEQAHRNSRGSEFWNTFDERYRTPPPPLRSAAPSTVSEDDLAMDMTPSNTNHAEFPRRYERPLSRSSATQGSQSAFMNEITRKRRRDDDFDPNLFKRRAVSPSMSAQSSPNMPNSPVVKDTGHNIWGPPPKSNLGSLFSDRPSGDSGSGNGNGTGAGNGTGNGTGNGNSNRNSHTGALKRVGLLGMTETNDGLMNMSIE